MKRLFILMVLTITSLQVVFAQADRKPNERMKEVNEARDEARLDKKLWLTNQATTKTPAEASVSPDNFWDNESFDKNVKFLGAFYAGTVYVYRSCDPQILLDEVGLVLAADDKCVAHSIGAPMATTTFSDPLWKVSIPGKTVDNVIYLMLNNNPGFDSYSGIAGLAQVIYSPQVTIESSALDDPAAINPNTGLPMNGTYTVSAPGSRTRVFSTTQDQLLTDYSSYAAIQSRGFSRDYFSAVGLPQHVIDKLYKKPMTLKFGMRVRVSGPIDFGQFYYSYRVLGN